VPSGSGPLLIGQSLELWREPLAAVAAARNSAALEAAAEAQLVANALRSGAAAADALLDDAAATGAGLVIFPGELDSGALAKTRPAEALACLLARG
jgi:hypothetical protein